MAIGSANGKTIILGEHFSVYGSKVIGFGIAKKIDVEICKSPEMDFEFVADEKVKKSVEIIKENLGIGNFRVRIVNSEINIGSGLGSSASLMVAIIRAANIEFGLNLDNARINTTAHKAEKIFHGTPTGIDNTLATYGGAVILQKTTDGPVVERPVIKKPLHIVLVDTGIKKDTLRMVQLVKDFKDRNEAIFLTLLDQASALANEAINNIKNGENAKLGPLMDENQELLAAIGVSHPEIDRVIGIARESGALGAKLVGAGGGGFCAALASDESAAKMIINKLGARYYCFYNLIK